jgi:hypothetical protein
MPSRPRKITKAPVTCKRETDLIAKCLASALEAQEQDAFERHHKACSDCVSFLQTYKKTIELTRIFLRQSQTTGPKELSLGPPIRRADGR